MADLIVNSLLVEGAPAARDAAIAQIPFVSPATDPTPYPTDAGVEVVFHTRWDPGNLDWVADLSQMHPDVTLTLGWEGETGSDVGWRRYAAGVLLAREDLDFLSWHTHEEWADGARAVIARGGLTCLFED